MNRVRLIKESLAREISPSPRRDNLAKPEIPPTLQPGEARRWSLEAIHHSNTL